MPSADGYIRDKGYDWRAFYCENCEELAKDKDMRDGLCPDCQSSSRDETRDESVVNNSLEECYLCGYEYPLSEIRTEIVDGGWRTVCSNCEVESESESAEKPTMD